MESENVKEQWIPGFFLKFFSEFLLHIFSFSSSDLLSEEVICMGHTG